MAAIRGSVNTGSESAIGNTRVKVNKRSKTGAGLFDSWSLASQTQYYVVVNVYYSDIAQTQYEIS